MKKIFFIVLICFVSLGSFAQIQRKVTKDTTVAAFEQKANKKRQKAELNLTKEQRGKMKEMAQANKAAKADIENDATLTNEQKAEKLRAIKKGSAQTMQTILTPEQIQKWMQMRKQKMNKQ